LYEVVSSTGSYESGNFNIGILSFTVSSMIFWVLHNLTFPYILLIYALKLQAGHVKSWLHHFCAFKSLSMVVNPFPGCKNAIGNDI
jgi:hypothetical protein